MPMIGQVITQEKFPQYLYHPDKGGFRRVDDIKEKTEAVRDGWNLGYRHQDYPKMMYHVVLEPQQVNSQEEEIALIAAGWENSPVMFSEEKALDAKIAQNKVEAKELANKKSTLRKDGKAA
jgi:hypothetical protein